MLSLARKTLNRVPSFQDILQGRMTHPDVYVIPLLDTERLLSCGSRAIAPWDSDGWQWPSMRAE